VIQKAYRKKLTHQKFEDQQSEEKRKIHKSYARGIDGHFYMIIIDSEEQGNSLSLTVQEVGKQQILRRVGLPEAYLQVEEEYEDEQALLVHVHQTMEAVIK